MAKPAKHLRPCYGGPYDGQFRPENYAPLGYRTQKVRGRMIWLWKSIKIERVDFDTMSKAARCREADYKDLEEKGTHLEPQ